MRNLLKFLSLPLFTATIAFTVNSCTPDKVVTPDNSVTSPLPSASVSTTPSASAQPSSKCVSGCSTGLTCDETVGICRPVLKTASVSHASFPQLQQTFTSDMAGGKAATAACLSCHPKAGTDMLKTAHWNFLGETPGLSGHETGKTVGKKNLINNFCIALPSNEQRCNECHPGYGWGNKEFKFDDTASIDCLSCHSTSYKKGLTTSGAPDTTVKMDQAVINVGRPTRSTCGSCHFGAGGGDNVKKGDMGSALKDPIETTDVHMGAKSYKFACVDCHSGKDHVIPGQGIHIPVSEGRVSCKTCHNPEPHKDANLNNHSKDISCQTCHIPGFSRQMPTKMDWDWSTSGDVTKGTAGIVKATQDGSEVTVYDKQKGTFVWKKNVRPEYAWYNGKTTHMTIDDTFAAGKGTKDNPIRLSGVTATIADTDAVIFPFKVMKGRQPVDITNRKVIAPKLYGPGSFWGMLGTLTTYDEKVIEGNWTKALTAGALYNGQLKEGQAYTGRASGTGPQWDWAYTEMWMGINHEVAPKSNALTCNNCHSGSSGWNWTTLGYTCDPANPPTGKTAKDCGSRH